MDKSEQKEVGFAWVDGVFWERWIRTTYGIEVTKDGEKVIINDEDVRSLSPSHSPILPNYY
jgi:protein disulfide-isomerase